MGYRKDLIKRFQESGAWKKLTTKQRTIFKGLSDEVACRLMVAMDEDSVDHAILMSDLTPTAAQEVREAAAMKCGREAVTNLLEVFEGKLLDRSEGQVCLSPLGQALADFLKCAEDAGFGLADSTGHLARITVSAAVMISMLGKRQD